ncbi:hypothetical protein QBC36DRAFT_315949 [Triangularia setosa]|uniref:Uncharacterized protein n=1 Tax=Triangularia setosa TaxID=2587417 RepID=A0AAN7A264_9PEZI|nr:hypothetical protein QBC36DRAFT_315949 [Podospora setosa]
MHFTVSLLTLLPFTTTSTLALPTPAPDIATRCTKLEARPAGSANLHQFRLWNLKPDATHRRGLLARRSERLRLRSVRLCLNPHPSLSPCAASLGDHLAGRRCEIPVLFMWDIRSQRSDCFVGLGVS